MAAVADSEARDRIAKLYTEHRELAADYWGPDKTNGKRSVVNELCVRMDTLETAVERRNQTRAQECLGLNALSAYVESRQEEETMLKVERIKAKSLMNVQWAQLAGIIIVALIALFK
ncbi:MAG: hypothetical protein AB7T74_02280 [Clostridia bacterium]